MSSDAACRQLRGLHGPRGAENPLRHNGNVRASEPRDAAVYAHLMYDEWRWREMFVVPSEALVRVIRPE